jgi:hypothetical protein
MRRRIYLLSTALILALANLIMLPITGNSVVPVAGGRTGTSGKGCRCGEDVDKQIAMHHKDGLRLTPASVDCRGCRKTYNDPNNTRSHHVTIRARSCLCETVTPGSCP